MSEQYGPGANARHQHNRDRGGQQPQGGYQTYNEQPTVPLSSLNRQNLDSSGYLQPAQQQNPQPGQPAYGNGQTNNANPAGQQGSSGNQQNNFQTSGYSPAGQYSSYGPNTTGTNRGQQFSTAPAVATPGSIKLVRIFLIVLAVLALADIGLGVALNSMDASGLFMASLLVNVALAGASVAAIFLLLSARSWARLVVTLFTGLVGVGLLVNIIMAGTRVGELNARSGEGLLLDGYMPLFYGGMGVAVLQIIMCVLAAIMLWRPNAREFFAQGDARATSRQGPGQYPVNPAAPVQDTSQGYNAQQNNQQYQPQQSLQPGPSPSPQQTSAPAHQVPDRSQAQPQNQAPSQNQGAYNQPQQGQSSYEPETTVLPRYEQNQQGAPNPAPAGNNATGTSDNSRYNSYRQPTQTQGSNTSYAGSETESPADQDPTQVLSTDAYETYTALISPKNQSQSDSSGEQPDEEPTRVFSAQQGPYHPTPQSDEEPTRVFSAQTQDREQQPGQRADSQPTQSQSTRPGQSPQPGADAQDQSRYHLPYQQSRPRLRQNHPDSPSDRNR